jgi:transcriptional regulator with XRE-family HTH domain
MITAAQLRAARSLAGLDQRKLAELSGLSLPTIQRMETSEDVIRGNVDSLTKLIAALDSIGIEFLGEGVVGPAGGRGVRFKKSANPSSDSWALTPRGPGVRATKSAASRKPAETDEAADNAPSSREGR